MIAAFGGVAFADASLAQPGAGPDAGPSHAEVTVKVTGLRNTRGMVHACMTDTVAGFPDCRKGGSSYRLTHGAAGNLTLAFTGVRPGRYAIALLHDENANGKADRAAMMIPTEGFGFSRDAPVRFGPPRFGQAAFDVAPGAHERLTIRMRYLL